MKKVVSEIFDTLIARYPILEREPVERAYALISDCYRSGGKLMVCGNGGSAADSEHIVGELMKGFLSRRMPSDAQQKALRDLYPADEAQYFIDHLQQGLPAISLVSQSGLLTAYANDVAADMVYAQQVFAYAKPGDLLIGITTSGGSKNVLNALKVARACGIKSVLLMGSRNAQNAALADVAICVKESETFKVQELHLPVYHALCAAIEAEYFC